VGVYLVEWDKLKKAFETATNQARPKETVQKALIGTVAKASGITPALKDVESALAKKERKTLEQAINKLEVTRQTYGVLLEKEQKQFNPSDDAQMVFWTAYRDLKRGLEQIVVDAGKAAKALQEEKSPIEGLQFLPMEAEVKSVLVDVKKKLTPYAALEKKHGLLKKADAVVKLAETYTKVAARTQVKVALETLKSIQKECLKCASELEKVAKAETDQGFKTALESYRKSMVGTANWSRLLMQIDNLKKRPEAS
jgi:hypothetical protein